MLWNLAAPSIKEGGGEEGVETGKLVDHIDMEQLTMGTPLSTPLRILSFSWEFIFWKNKAAEALDFGPSGTEEDENMIEV